MELKFSDSDFNYLSQFEASFNNAVNSDYCSNPGYTAMTQINRIWERYIGRPNKVGFNCSRCILRFMKTVGRAYLNEKAVRENADNVSVPEVTEQAITEPIVKKRKTRKKL